MNEKSQQIELTYRATAIIICSERRELLCQKEAHYILWLHLRLVSNL